jgi:hypothetical protein
MFEMLPTKIVKELNQAAPYNYSYFIDPILVFFLWFVYRVISLQEES